MKRKKNKALITVIDVQQSMNAAVNSVCEEIKRRLDYNRRPQEEMQADWDRLVSAYHGNPKDTFIISAPLGGLAKKMRIQLFKGGVWKLEQ